MKQNDQQNKAPGPAHKPMSRRNFVKAAGAMVGAATLAHAAFHPAESSTGHAPVLVQFEPGGRITVACGSPGLSTGACTVMARVAAATLNLRMELIDPRLGGSAGLQTAVVQAAALQARLKLLAAAAADSASPLYGAQPDQLDFKYGRIIRKGEPESGESFTAYLARNGNRPLGAMASRPA
jgi:xanthine dehydrogenase YagR molybdenum-binding subunit